jgi:hypothetical protein
VRPHFSGDEEPVSVRVVGDSVQYVVWTLIFQILNALQVNPRRDLTGLDVNNGDPLFSPNVRVDSAFYVLKLVELSDGCRIVYSHLSDSFESDGIQEVETRRSIAHYESLAIVG